MQAREAPAFYGDRILLGGTRKSRQSFRRPVLLATVETSGRNAVCFNVAHLHILVSPISKQTTVPKKSSE